MENTFNTHNVLHQAMYNYHPILGENVGTDVSLRNETLKNRLMERCNDDADTLPIHEFKYERCLFYIYMDTQYAL